MRHENRMTDLDAIRTSTEDETTTWVGRVSRADVRAIFAALDAVRAENADLATRLDRANDYHPDGRCRACGGGTRRVERPHATWCRLYVGPVTHRWARIEINGTFGGIDHYCTCGGWFRQGGLAGHGDGTETAEPICPKRDETRRGNAAPTHP